MKFQKSTLILILIALIFGGVVYVWEVEGKPQREAAKIKENRVFSFEEKDVKSLVLKTKEYKLQFDRVDAKAVSNPTASKWMLKILEKSQIEPAKTSTETKSPEVKLTESPEVKPTESPEAKPTESPEAKPTESPEAKATESPRSRTRRSRAAKERETQEDLATYFAELQPPVKAEEELQKEMPANEAYVAYLLNELATGKGDRIIADPRTEDGLDKPLATVEVTLNDGKQHLIILGNPNFNNTALYAIADPPQQVTKPLDILLVSTNFQNAVNRPLSEWKQQSLQPETTVNPTPKPTLEPSPTTDKPSTEVPKIEASPTKEKVEESKKESPPPESKKPRKKRKRE